MQEPARSLNRPTFKQWKGSLLYIFSAATEKGTPIMGGGRAHGRWVYLDNAQAGCSRRYSHGLSGSPAWHSWQQGMSVTTPWFWNDLSSAILQNHFRSPFPETTAKQTCRLCTVRPSKNKRRKSAAISFNISMRTCGCSWWTELGIINKAKCCKKECPFMFVHCFFSRSHVCSRNFLDRGPYFCLMPSWALQSQEGWGLFFCRAVWTPMTASHETTTVLPRRFPRPSSPCQAMGTTVCRLSWCSW